MFCVEMYCRLSFVWLCSRRYSLRTWPGDVLSHDFVAKKYCCQWQHSLKNLGKKSWELSQVTFFTIFVSKGVCKISRYSNKAAKLATLLLAVCLSDWLEGRETSDWLETIPCWKKRIGESTCINSFSRNAFDDNCKFFELSTFVDFCYIYFKQGIFVCAFICKSLNTFVNSSECSYSLWHCSVPINAVFTHV